MSLNKSNLNNNVKILYRGVYDPISGGKIILVWVKLGKTKNVMLLGHFKMPKQIGVIIQVNITYQSLNCVSGGTVVT